MYISSINTLTELRQNQEYAKTLRLSWETNMYMSSKFVVTQVIKVFTVCYIAP
jgi:hypothetical protein